MTDGSLVQHFTKIVITKFVYKSGTILQFMLNPIIVNFSESDKNNRVTAVL